MKKTIFAVLLGLTTITANADFKCDHGIYSPFNGEATLVQNEDGSTEFHMDLNRVRYSRLNINSEGKDWLNHVLGGAQNWRSLKLTIKYPKGHCRFKNEVLTSCQVPSFIDDKAEIEVNGYKTKGDGSFSILNVTKLTSESVAFEPMHSFNIFIGAIGQIDFARCTKN
ncbi:MAG: hypothetical protein E2O68_03440 [Deltaproteobacteria bacterium]|nr:MAG: hypothetical protein E2O68_03440 [Deltaproteobacteria bacterium]